MQNELTTEKMIEQARSPFTHRSALIMHMADRLERQADMIDELEKRLRLCNASLCFRCGWKDNVYREPCNKCQWNMKE